MRIFKDKKGVTFQEINSEIEQDSEPFRERSINRDRDRNPSSNNTIIPNNLDQNDHDIQDFNQESSEIDITEESSSVISGLLSRTVILKESKSLLSLALPVIGSYCLNYVNQMIPLLTLGHLGTKYLAAISLATMTCNITGFSVGYGLATALDTLCSQAFTGARDKKELGRHLQRSMFVMVLASIPILTLWSFTEPILLKLGQDEEISRLAGQFMIYLAPGLFPQLIFSCIQRYLQAQSIMSATFIVSFLTLPVNGILQYILVFGFGSFKSIGAIGAPLATAISMIFNCIMIIIYASYFEGYECWGGFEYREIFDFDKIKKFLALGIPGVAMLCSEWWAFEVVALLAGLLGDEYLAAQTIMLNTGGLTYMVPMSLGIATSTRIGNSLGAKLANTARHIAYASFILGLGFSILNCVGLISVRNIWGGVYSNDPKVIELVAQVIPLAAFFQLNDGFGAIGGGILRGSGRQKFGAYLNLSGYYIFGLPLGALFTFYFKMGLVGIWLGLTIGIFYVSVFQFIIITRYTDWKEMADNAVRLVGSNETSLASASIDEEAPFLIYH